MILTDSAAFTSPIAVINLTCKVFGEHWDVASLQQFYGVCRILWGWTFSVLKWLVSIAQ